MQRQLKLLALCLVALSCQPVHTSARAQQPTTNDQKQAEQSAPDPTLDAIKEGIQGIWRALETQNAQADAEREANYAGRDLKAQADMATWAFVQMWISLGALIVSAVALGFLFVSLRQTRKALADNELIGKAEVRAYLSIIRLRAPQEGPYAIMYDIANQGSSPARGLIAEHALWFPLPNGALHPLVQVEEGTQPDFLSDLGAEPEAVSFRDILMGDAMLRQHIRGLTREYPARLVVRLRYQDVFDRYFECIYVSDFYRVGHDITSDELDYARLQSREIAIDKERYEKRDQVTIPGWALPPPKA